MKCTRCGFENRPDARFCKQCGQPLVTQAAPPPLEEMLCPACGASYKPGARFCSRCGNPLTTGAMPPQPPTQPSMPPPPAYAPEFGTPPFQQPPPPAAVAYRPRRVPTLVWVVGALVLLLCIVGLGVGVFYLGPKLGLPLPSRETPTATPAATATPTVMAAEVAQPTDTPAPAPVDVGSFGAQALISASSNVASPGSILTVTVTINNTGGVSLSELRYQLLGEWGNILGVTPDIVAREVELEPGQSDSAVFELEAREAGQVSLRANVTMKISGTTEVRAVNSDVVTIQVQ